MTRFNPQRPFATACFGALLGLTLTTGVAKADVLTYSQLAALDSNIIVQYSFDGATTTERQEDKTSGTNDLIIKTQGSGSGAAISYNAGFDGSSDAVSPQRINGSNGAAFSTSAAIDTTANTAYSYEAILQVPEFNDGGTGYIVAARSSTITRDYWSVHQHSGSGADSVVTTSGDNFTNTSNIVPSVTGGSWYYVAVTKELVAGNTQVNTWMANLSNGDTALTQVATNQTVSGSFQNNIAMGVGMVNSIGSYVEAFGGAIDEVSLYSGLRTQSNFQTSLDRINASPTLVYEPFDYSAGDLNTNNSSASGLTGAWSGNTSFDVTAGSLNYPASSPLSSTANKGELSGSNGTNPRIDRTMSTPISFDEAGVYYVSFLMNDTDAGGSEYFYVALQDSTAPDQTWDITAAFGISSSETMLLTTVDGQTGYTAGGAIPTGQDVLVIGKIITTASGNDQVFMSVYDPSETVPLIEPISWDLSKSVEITGLADQLLLMSGPDTQTRVDEIRIGTTFNSVAVAAIPTPTALPAGLALLTMAAMRRRK